MIKRTAMLVFLALFVFGAVSALASDKPVVRKNKITQSVYNWFGTLDKFCVNKTERCCKACEKKCCDACNIDCGGTCCADCTPKP